MTGGALDPEIRGALSRRVIAAFLTTFLFGVSALFARRVTHVIRVGSESNFWRLAVAAAFLAVWAFGFGQGLEGPSFAWFLLGGLVGFGIGDIAYMKSLPALGARLSILVIHCLATPFAALVEWLWLGTRLTWGQAGLAALILCGVGLALAPAHAAHHSRGEWFRGVALAVVAALGQGGGAVISRKAYQVAELSGFPVDGITAAFQRIIGGIVISGVALLWAHRRHLLEPSPAAHGAHKWRKAWPYIVLNSLSGPALGVSCYQWALQTTPTGVVLPIVALTPIVLIPFSMRFDGERVSRRSVLGSCLAVSAAVALALG